MIRNQVKKPLIIQLVGWALIFAPIGYYITTALQWQNWSVVVLIEQLLALPHGPLKLLVILSSPLVGLAVHSVKAIGWISFMLYCGATIFVNFYIAYSSEVVTNFSASLYSLTGALAILVYLVRKEIMAPYFNPKMRWWESAERFPFKLDVLLKSERGEEKISSRTFDISVSGCFLTTDLEYQTGQKIDLNIKLIDPVDLQAEVVWVCPGNENVPKGIGIRFISNLKEITTQVDRFKEKYSKAERFPFQLDAEIQQSGGTEQINAKTFDISVSGCFLITDHPYEAGQQLELNLKLLEPINLTAQVIWISAGDAKIPQGIGVKFTSHLDEVSMMVTRFKKNYGPTVPEKKMSASPV
ncbi:MAG: PilZ domain-containing protein [SAR324 cluster bacterium]|nr:PilZ domain-containing protein [SAR324 cluster bacterium]